jgi:hypothetical protein
MMRRGRLAVPLLNHCEGASRALLYALVPPSRESIVKTPINERPRKFQDEADPTGSLAEASLTEVALLFDVDGVRHDVSNIPFWTLRQSRRRPGRRNEWTLKPTECPRIHITPELGEQERTRTPPGKSDPSSPCFG